MERQEQTRHEVIAPKGMEFVEAGIASREQQAFAISVLRDQIYSNKVRAVCREYLANATDEHIKYGVDRPVEVIIPDSLDPNFRMRDYGKGLSKDGLFHHFVQYGLSDKNDNNVQTGMLGIGAKSGWAYTDSFTVTSWHKGIESVYSLVLESQEFEREDGTEAMITVGKAYLLNEQPSDEPSGLEISIPVQRGDTYKFKNELLDVAQWFEIKPSVKYASGGGLDIPEVAKVQSVPSGDTWFFRASEGYNKNAVAVMGNMAYNIDGPAISELSDNEQKLLGNFNLVLKFDLGDLAVAPSREGLQYTGKTQAKIRQRLRHIKGQLARGVQAEIDKAETIFEANRIYDDQMGLFGRAVVYGGSPVDVKWRDRPVRRSNEFGLGEMYRYRSDDEGNVTLVTKRDTTMKFHESDQLCYLVAERNLGGINRARALYSDEWGLSKDQDVVVCRFHSEEAMASAFEHAKLKPEEDGFISWEDIDPKRPSRKTSAGRRKGLNKRGLLTLTGYNRYRKSHNWNDWIGDEAVPEKAVYVKLKRFDPYGDGLDDVGINRLQDMIKYMRQAKWFDGYYEEVVGVRPSAGKKVPQGWVTVTELLKAKLNEPATLKQVTDYFKKLATRSESQEAMTYYKELFRRVTSIHSKLEDPLLKKYIAECESTLSSASNDTPKELVNIMVETPNNILTEALPEKVRQASSKDAESLTKMKEKLTKRYPLLPMLQQGYSYYITNHTDALVDYFNTQYKVKK